MGATLSEKKPAAVVRLDRVQGNRARWRALFRAYVPKVYHGQSTDKTLSDKNLDRLGFTKYVKTDHGYEKRTGPGPEQLGGQESPS